MSGAQETLRSKSATVSKMLGGGAKGKKGSVTAGTNASGAKDSPPLSVPLTAPPGDANRAADSPSREPKADAKVAS